MIVTVYSMRVRSQNVKTLFKAVFNWIYSTDLPNDYENLLIFLLNILVRAPLHWNLNQGGWLSRYQNSISIKLQ